LNRQNKYFIIEDNIISFLQEQVYILGKEYEYIFLIANFYTGESESSNKADLEKNFLSMKNLIKDENKKLIHINKYIEKNLKHTRNEQKEDIIDILISIDHARKDINKLINKFEKINEKLIQMLRDGYNQYIPKPIIGKRHSNINIISQLELKINKSKNSKNEDPNHDFFMIWNFSHSYQVSDLDKDKTMINLSYWIFDTPYLMPSITHEIIHKRMVDFEKLKSIIFNIFETNKEMKKNKKEIFRFTNNKKALGYIIEDITIDIVSFLKHGNAYILTMATSFFGYFFASTFKIEIKDNSFDIAPWDFLYNRDIPILRLFILVNLVKEIRHIKQFKEHDKFEQNISNVDHIYNLMKKIYFSEALGFKKIYTNYHNYKRDYYLIVNLIESITKDIINSSRVRSEIIKLFNEFYPKRGIKKVSFEKNLKLPLTLNDIWERRLNGDNGKDILFTLPNNIEYRKKIHSETIQKLLDKKYLSSIDNIKPYEITFIKIKLPEKKDEEFKCFNFSSIYGDDKYYNTLGIYDFVKIKYQKNSVIQMESDVLEKLEKKKNKHYKSFISLMKIMDSVIGKNNKKEFNTIIQIEINKNLKEENIRDTYDDLFSDLEKVRNMFIDENIIKKDYFAKVEFYKSLGPKDIVIIVKNCSLNTIYDIKDAIAKESSLKRSYTTIFYDEDEESVLKVGNKYNLISELRANNSSKENKNCIENYFNITKEFKQSSIYKVAGVMDYKIVWNSRMTLKEVNNIYDNVIKNGYVQDLQTIISKKV